MNLKAPSFYLAVLKGPRTQKPTQTQLLVFWVLANERIL